MDFISYLFWNHLPCVKQEIRVVDGVEQVCLIIPTKFNQLKKGEKGDWLSTFRMTEEPPNAEMITHTVQLGYLNWDEVKKARMMGYYPRTQRMGRVYEHDRTPSKKIDRTNKASDIRLDGIIVLSDIPKNLIFRSGHNNKRYLSNLTMRGMQDDGYIYTGSICLDDIPREAIQTNNENGKKFINVRLRKMEYLDTFFNTHELVIARPDGEDAVVIGLFKEWKKEGYVPPTEPIPYIPPSEPERKQPDSIQGIKF